MTNETASTQKNRRSPRPKTINEQSVSASNTQVLLARLQEHHQRCQSVIDQLAAIEDAIDHVSYLLNRSQPNFAGGKIGVRWWKIGGNEYRSPVLVHWEYVRNGKDMKPVPYKRRPRLIRDDEHFALNADITKSLVDHFYSLQDMWLRLMNRFYRMTDRRTSRGSVYEKELDTIRDDLDRLQKTLKQRLQEAGFLADV